jgi:hypothetical protein
MDKRFASLNAGTEMEFCGKIVNHIGVILVVRRELAFKSSAFLGE